ncbi:conjugal transfer protein TraG, partial [Sinorhizobium sp. 6-117]|nr:conjugal transfer protein TraG [Sinorhizobium sp. 6-117]
MTRSMLFLAPCALMILTAINTGIELWLSAFGKSEAARQTLGRAGIALPYIVASLVGMVLLFGAARSSRERARGWCPVGGA